MDACEQIARACWPADPTLPLDRDDFARTLQREQAAVTSRLNSKWAEKARLKVQQVVPDQVKRARRTFFGRLTYLDSRTEDGSPHNLPNELLTALTAGEIAALKDAGKVHGEAVLCEARALAGREGLAPREAALAWLFDHVTRRFGRPEFGRDPRFVAQLHLDKDCLRPVKQAYQQALRDITAALPGVLASGTPVSFTFSVTPVAAGDDPFALNVAVGLRNLRHALVAEARADNRTPAGVARGLNVRSLCLEIGPKRATLKAVLGRPEAVNSDLVIAADQAVVKAGNALARATQELQALQAADQATPADLAKAGDKAAKTDLEAAKVRAVTLNRRFRTALRACAAVIGVAATKACGLSAYPESVTRSPYPSWRHPAGSRPSAPSTLPGSPRPRCASSCPVTPCPTAR
jgi:hypothetical protein